MAQRVALAGYRRNQHEVGASLAKAALWYGIGYPLVRSHFLTSSRLRGFILRLFGASIGRGVVLKPGLRVKYPWKLSVGDSTWIGESVWLDTVVAVEIGADVCISQGVYLCTGNHDWSSPVFDLRAAPIAIQDSAWLGARSCVGPGVTVETGAVLTLGSVATSDLTAFHIYSGNPGTAIRQRMLRES